MEFSPTIHLKMVDGALSKIVLSDPKIKVVVSNEEDEFYSECTLKHIVEGVAYEIITPEEMNNRWEELYKADAKLEGRELDDLS